MKCYEIQYENATVTKKSEIANVLNTHFNQFNEIGTKLANDIEECTVSH
jgi:hypothetical protein